MFGYKSSSNKPAGRHGSSHHMSHSSSGGGISSHKPSRHHRDPRSSSTGTVVAAVTTDDRGLKLPAEPSFLFVVNELQIDLEPPPPGSSSSSSGSSSFASPDVGTDGGPRCVLRDQWHNTMPPQHSSAYTSEIAGTVFRYRSGIVTPAPNYFWCRPAGWHSPGHIVRVDPRTNLVDGWPIPYDNDWGSSTQTLFSCSPHLPLIVSETDATLGTAYVRKSCRCNAQHYPDSYAPWNLLHFESSAAAGSSESSSLSGAPSFVNAQSRGTTSVRGAQPSWMPSLVPNTYRNSKSGLLPSAGLSGQLPTLIGLMGFQGAPGNVSSVFSGQKWDRNRWVGSNQAPRHVPKGDDGDKPRGLLVQVCIDNLQDGLEDNEENNLSTAHCMAWLSELEWRCILVEE